MKKHLAFLAAGVAAFAFVVAPAKADTVTAFGDATGSGPWTISSTSSTYGGVEVAISGPLTFSQLLTLSATFTDTLGGG